jgi:single-stranded DNA-binding protein
MLGVNRVVLVGTIGKYGVSVTYMPNGTAHATFALVVNERGQDGKEHMLLIPCELWGKRVEATGELEPGTLVSFEGRLRRAKDKERDTWQIIVSGLDLSPLQDGKPSPQKSFAY